MVSFPEKPSIFVHIPAYRDPEILPTLQDLYAQAKDPDNIYVGVCWQYDPFKGEEPLSAPLRVDQIRVANYMASQSQGVGWARYKAQKLYQNEAFVLQVDGHSRFAQHWDSFLLAQWQQCNDERAVLSCLPAAYDQTNGKLKKAVANTRYPKGFKENGLLELDTVFLREIPEQPLDAVFASPKFIFAPAPMLADVPSDPMVYFAEEEVSLSIRIWSQGWNIYIPTQPPIYHSFNSTGQKRPLHWKDNSNWSMLQQRASRRYAALLAEEGSDKKAAFGLGRSRSLQDFVEFCGVDLVNQVIKMQAALDLAKRQPQPLANGAKSPPADAAVANQNGATPQNGAAQQEPATVVAAPVPTQKLKTATVTSAPLPTGAQTESATQKPATVSYGDGEVLSQAPVLLSDFPLPMSTGLDPGDFIPYFRLHDQEGRLREIHSYGGLRTVLICLPTEESQLLWQLNVLKAAWESLRQHDLQVVAIAAHAPETLKQLHEKHQLPFSLWSDPDNRVSQTLGSYNAEQQAAEVCGYVLTSNLRIQKKYALDNPAAAIGKILADVPPPAPMPGPIMTMHAPVLIVPNVLTSEQCRFLIQHWQQGNQFEGKVGAGTQTRAQKGAKVRTDILLKNPMMAKVDYMFGGTLFPEIEKVFGLKVTHREEYKIGCYDATKGGFFKQHRDNFDRFLSHRRVAMTLNLNDDYDGGGLNFPEYGNFVYRPEAGGAVVFPCSLMHQALPVTAGQRFMMVSFFFGEAEVNHRLKCVTDAEEHYAASKRTLLAPSKIELPGQDNVRARYSFDQS
ncbi:MAG: GlcNAc-transferase family protein [Cyanobacteria bacterium J06639_14]